jgi:aerobactin synthase
MTDAGRSSNEVWQIVNRELVAKALSELAYEQILAPAYLERGADQTWCILRLASGTTYEYEGRRTIWGQVEVHPHTIRRLCQERVDDPQSETPLDAAQFLLDASAELNTTPVTLAGLLGEISQTLFADVRLYSRRLTAAELAGLSSVQRQAQLSGHPKMLANKGRIGWGCNELEMYAPEFAEPFQVHWLAADRRTAVIARDAEVSEEDLLLACLPARDRQALTDRMTREGITADDYVIIPVHPWQWSNVVVIQYAGELAAGRLVSLGRLGDGYRPQLSVRTLANADRPLCYDLKLSLSIMNTSVYRGIRHSWARSGPALSKWLCRLAAADPELSGRLDILAEHAGVHYPHPSYSKVVDAPYQYSEQLGAIWRCSAESMLNEGEQAVLLATFGEYDKLGRPLADHYIRQSGLSAGEWLRNLFDAVTVPLYHLLCRYGFCPIPHGQNVVVILREGVPVRYALKDFHGDLVRDKLPIQEGLPEWVASLVPREPDGLIVQNILTAHLATTLRFVSNALISGGVSEDDFYQILGRCLRRYQDAHPELTEQFARFDLFAPTMARYCLNRVRLITGYSDQARRPPKIFGTPIANPLALTDLSANEPS